MEHLLIIKYEIILSRYNVEVKKNASSPVVNEDNFGSSKYYPFSYSKTR